MATLAELIDAADAALLEALQSNVAEWGEGGVTAKHHAVAELTRARNQLRAEQAAEMGCSFSQAVPLKR